MWTSDDDLRLVVRDMDRRACPSYEAGSDACDPIGSVFEWSERCPAKVLRRRCRSEGIERSPYEDVNGDLRSAEGGQKYKTTNKNQFTLRERYSDRFNIECSLPVAENGDYPMAQNRHHNYNLSTRSKLNHLSLSRPLLVSTLSNTKEDDKRLPKVEELLEKVDQDMSEVTVAKQPLKSILNNPLPMNPLQGILKKPKNKAYMDPKTAEGRRRQRAASESDNLYCSYHLQSSVQGFDSRLSYLSNNMKRAKDNSGTGYSYCAPLANSNPISKSPTLKSAAYQKSRCACKDGPKSDVQEMHLLKTTAINSSTVDEDFELPRPEIPSLTFPPVSPTLPVSSVTAVAAKKPVKKVKPKSKVSAKGCNKMDCGGDDEAEDANSRSPSPDVYLSNWQMETDAAIADLEKQEKEKQLKMEKQEKPPPVKVQSKTEETAEQNSVTKLSAKLNGTAVSPPKKVPSKESFVALPESVTNSLRPSLFPRVPPYLKFVSYDVTSPLKIPAQIQKHLKWKLTTITPIVVKRTLVNSGFRLVKSECDTAECPQEETLDWIGIWGKHMKSIMFRAIKDGQKMNHFPGTFQIGRKDRLWRNLQKLSAKHGLKEFGIMPKTYVLPHDLKLLKHDWEKYAANNERWIIKPPASARGTGIKVVSRWTQIPKKRPVVVQRYVSKPYLINGSKFDLRLYVLVTSVHPLRIYMYKDGLARFASVKYTDEITSLNDRYMHLTNYSINRLSKNYMPNEDFNACEGHKWTLHTLFQYLKTEKNVDTTALWDSLKDMVIKTIISGEASISSLTKANITSRYNCYELFGIDVLLDEDLKPWLLEVNISPSLHSASPLDIHVKGPMVTTVLNIAQFQVPSKTNVEMLTKDKHSNLSGLPYDSRLYTVYLSKEERDKHIIYTNMEERETYLRDILSTLTPDDVRHLIQAEDEFTQTGDMERIFPSHDTHKYLNYLAGPRYYNRLFDAWETRYSHDRSAGITLLRSLCDIGYHLEVPPVPLKPALSQSDGCRMTWTRRRPRRPSAAPCLRWARWKSFPLQRRLQLGSAGTVLFRRCLPTRRPSSLAPDQPIEDKPSDTA